ncbi:hypothetical protein L873DRAFT_1795519 [Choiromyces venosus 120613-1]|uniref:Uncharacterized protein n=1 Tax=Choiromyces venosus 120613-1 TaxID=1336337 RepID=A0A3N4IWV8_9PEZI|nr:hypothetical protein L873DRAFT_1795519 [Choiromyces venosus 120613-1]
MSARTQNFYHNNAPNLQLHKHSSNPIVTGAAGDRLRNIVAKLANTTLSVGHAKSTSNSLMTRSALQPTTGPPGAGSIEDICRDWKAAWGEAYGSKRQDKERGVNRGVTVAFAAIIEWQEGLCLGGDREDLCVDFENTHILERVIPTDDRLTPELLIASATRS